MVPAAALAIGALLPFTQLLDSRGSPASLATFQGKTTIVLVSREKPAERDFALLDKFAALSTDETPIQAALIAEDSAVEKKNLLVFNASNEILARFPSGAKNFLVINSKGRITKWWLSPDENKIVSYVADWLSGVSLSAGYECVDPRAALVAVPSLPAPTDWFTLLKQAILLRFPPPGVVPRDPNEKGLLVIFLSSRSAGTELYLERIRKLSQQARVQGISVLGLFPDYDEKPEVVSAFIANAKFDFPCSIDKDNAFADAYRATRAPEVFLMDSKLRLVYTGAIDSSSFDAPETTAYLLNAISALREGKKPPIAKTIPFGTIIRRSPGDDRQAAVTYFVRNIGRQASFSSR